jgi:hypothetical protein
MIIVMAEDASHMDNAAVLAARINASLSATAIPIPSRPILFENTDFSTVQVDRVTFLGHGGKSRFGSRSQHDEQIQGLSPSEFVEALLAKGFPGIIRTIDLVGCNIGLGVDNKSYVAEVAALLKENEITAHVKVRAFIGNAELFSRLIVSSEITSGKMYISGIKNESEDEYQRILKDIKVQNV